MTIGEKITKLRKDNNVTQEQFAELLKVSRQSVSKWELNQVYPDTDKLIRISKLFNCSLDYLLKDEIENMDINIASESEDARNRKLTAWVLTYLSFPPLFGWIIGIYSLIKRKKHMLSKRQIVLSAIGIIFSMALTLAIILGGILEL